MAFELSLNDSELRLTISGLEALICFSQGLEIAISDLVGARVETRREAKKQIGLRVGGGYIPGVLATGHFTIRGEKGARQFWHVFRDPEVLVVETRIDRPRRLVLQASNRVELAARINDLVAKARS